MADMANRTEDNSDLLGDPNASNWAKRFVSMFRITRQDDYPDSAYLLDSEGLMLAWFAASIETGRMHSPPPLDFTEDIRKFLEEIVGGVTLEDARKMEADWKNSPDLNEGWIAHIVVIAAELLATQRSR